MNDSSVHRSVLFIFILVLSRDAMAIDVHPATGSLFEQALTADTATQEKAPQKKVAKETICRTDYCRISFYWENDGSAAKANDNHDRHYTNGAGFSIAHAPAWANDLAEVIPLSGDFDNNIGFNTVGYLFGHMFFTPEDLSTPALIATDRPYAGYMYAGFFFERSNEQTLDHFQIDIGLAGPSALAENIQDTVHDLSGTDKAQGWDNQIPDEPTFQFYLRKKWRMSLLPTDKDASMWGLQLIPQVGAALGTVYRHVEGYATVRLGVNLPDDFGPTRLADVTGLARSLTRDRFSVYGFCRAGGRIVEHNLFIEGSDFQNSHGVDAETFVGEIQLGALIQYTGNDCGWTFGYSQTYLTDSFRGQTSSDSYGAFTLSCFFDF